MEDTALIPKDLKDRIHKNNQDHLLHYISEYSKEELESYIEQLRGVNFEQVSQVQIVNKCSCLETYISRRSHYRTN